MRRRCHKKLGYFPCSSAIRWWKWWWFWQDGHTRSVVWSSLLRGKRYILALSVLWGFPGVIRVDWNDSWFGRTQAACDGESIIINRDRPFIKAQAMFSLHARNGIQRMLSHMYLTNGGMFCYQTHGEMDYLDALICILVRNIDEWSSIECFALEL